MANDFNLQEELLRCVQSGIAKAVNDKLGGYNSPLDKILASTIEAQANDIKALLNASIAAALASDGFREQIASSVRKKLADLLVQRFGGELEKQVNAMKSDPSTRARITVAIDEIIQSMAKA